MAREQLKTLTEPMYYILLSLNEERYGYEIMKYINEFTEGRVEVGPGTLYALLGRFENEKIIEKVSTENRRKNYIITDFGRELLEEERQRLLILLKDSNKILEDEIRFGKIDRENKEETLEDESIEEESASDENKESTIGIFKRSDDDILF